MTIEQLNKIKSRTEAAMVSIRQRETCEQAISDLEKNLPHEIQLFKDSMNDSRYIVRVDCNRCVLLSVGQSESIRRHLIAIIADALVDAKHTQESLNPADIIEGLDA